jgi:hypothetical protein
MGDAMSLSNDTAQCMCHFIVVDSDIALHPTCIDCKRRAAKTLSEYQWWMQGEVVDGKCEHKIFNPKEIA